MMLSLDLQTISVIASATSVTVAAIYYILTVRNNNRARKAQILLSHTQIYVSQEFLDAWV
jgi:hypothetical protein